MKIKDIEFKNNIILAPMAGVTDMAFRSICIDFGADAGVTEMISAKALMYNNQKTIDLLKTAPNEKIKIVQLFGSDPDIMASACKHPEIQKFDIIDINMGCPAPKIVNNHEGSFLMTNIDLASKIIKSCVSATDKPITVKFRSGYDSNNINAIEFAKMCEKAGASAITIHARTRTQMYSGQVDLDMVKRVKESVKIPVIASGDIVDRESYLRTLEYTHVDAVMIGRGALGNPQIFSEILGMQPKVNKMDIIKKHINMLLENYPESFVNGHIRKHLLWYLKGEYNATEIKRFVSTEPDLQKILDRLEIFFAKSK